MQRWWSAFLLAGLAGGACDASDASLVVELRTDFVPVVEFAYARATVDDDLAGAPVVGLRASDFTESQRLGEFGPLTPGAHRVHVELRDADDVRVAERTMVVRVRAATVAVVLLTRACDGVDCPGPADAASATECANGYCVPPECGGTEEACPGRCVGDGDCAAAVADCAQLLCVRGECLAVPRDTCGPSAYCHPSLGCLDLPGVDAGPPDASVSDAGADAGLADAGMPDACVPGVEVCNGIDDDCNGVVDEARCAANETCLGADGCQCQAGWFDCGAEPGCETPEDDANCGACGNRCVGGTPVCDTAADACVSGCGSGVARCGGSCVSTDTDPAHCGSCDAACSSAQGTPFCAGGTCGIRCDVGWDDCDGDVTNGCEQPLTSLAHCGACNVPCEIPNATASCETGVCLRVACAMDYDDCDGIPSNGCEQSLDSRDHCGACGSGCTTNEGCSSPGTCHCGLEGNGPSGTGTSVCSNILDHVAVGRCTGAVPARCAVVTCDPGWGNCDGANYTGCETRLGTNTDCASCGDACGAPLTCVSGSCR